MFNMKKFVIPIILGLLLLVGCNGADVVSTEIPVAELPTTAPTAQLPTATSTTLPTIAPIVESPTPIPESTPLPSPTTPPTQTPIATPEPTGTAVVFDTSLPQPSGQIYFLLDKQPLSAGSPYGFEPRPNLYQARFKLDNGLVDWQIQPVLEELIGWPHLLLSPDGMKFSLTVLEDKNGDGSVSQGGYNRWFDAPNIFTYTPTNGKFERVTDDYPSFLLGWLSSKQLTINKDHEFFVTSLDGTSRYQVLTEYSESVIDTKNSPDGYFISANLNSNQVSVVTAASDETTIILDESGGDGTNMEWSPNSAYLAIAHPSTDLIILDLNSLMLMPIPEDISANSIAWSPDSQNLAFIQSDADKTNLFLLDLENLSTTHLISVKGFIRDLLWSPDGTTLSMIAEEDGFSLNIIDIATHNYRELWHSNESTRMNNLAWSPDGQWLLFSDGGIKMAYADNIVTIYTIHRDDKNLQTVLETSNTANPYAFFWLP